MAPIATRQKNFASQRDEEGGEKKENEGRGDDEGIGGGRRGEMSNVLRDFTEYM